MAGVTAALLIALAWAGLVVPLGPRLGFVDMPDDASLKRHTRPAVPLGGVGVFLGVHTGMAIEGIFDVGLAAGTGGLLVLGLLDDRLGLSPRLRLVVEVAMAFVIVASADGAWSTDPLPLIVGIVLVVVAVNAVNLFDGLDGLVATSAAVAAVGVAALGDLRGLNAIVGLVLAGALVGFLFLNWSPAKVFLGDNGSYVVGAFLAYGIMRVSPEPVDSRFIVASVLLGVFALDLATTVLRRRLSGRPLFVGDRSHIYDQLRDRGWTVPRVALTMAAVEAGYVGLALGVEQIRNGPARMVLVGAIAAGSLLVARAAGFLRPQAD